MQQLTAMWRWLSTCVAYHLIGVSIHQKMATVPFSMQQSTAMWMWCGTCVTYLLIEV